MIEEMHNHLLKGSEVIGTEVLKHSGCLTPGKHLGVERNQELTQFMKFSWSAVGHGV